MMIIWSCFNNITIKLFIMHDLMLSIIDYVINKIIYFIIYYIMWILHYYINFIHFQTSLIYTVSMGSYMISSVISPSLDNQGLQSYPYFREIIFLLFTFLFLPLFQLLLLLFPVYLILRITFLLTLLKL